VSLAWDQENLYCRLAPFKVDGTSDQLDSRTMRLYVAAGNKSEVLTREVHSKKSDQGDAASQNQELRIPWQDLGLKPAAGQELQIMAALQSGDGESATIHTTGELPKQPVEQSLVRWPKYMLVR
jgi:hypothetical protein